MSSRPHKIMSLQGLNSVFSLRLEDITDGAFTIEPTMATGSTSVNIRVANGSLDYENPNQRKFIILVNRIHFRSDRFRLTLFENDVTSPL